MVNRRSTRSATDAPTKTGSRWRKIPQVQVTLGAIPDVVAVDAGIGDLVWVELASAHQVVGVIEAVATSQGLDGTALAERAASFADVEAWAPDSVPDAQLPTATVVVATAGTRPDDLARTIGSLCALDYPRFDIVVVDNRGASSGRGLKGVPDDARVRVVTEPVPGASSARNRGMLEATGDVVAFVDDDTVADKEWLRAIGARFAVDPEVDMITGLVLPLELDTPPQLWFEEFYGGFSREFRPARLSLASSDGQDPLFPYALGRFGASCNIAFRTTALARVGGFDPVLGVGTRAHGGEDLAIMMTMVLTGATIRFEPAALVRHSHRRTEREFLRQVLGYGIGLTAMYTSLVVHEPRHIGAMLARVPAGLRLLVRSKQGRSPSTAPGYPRRTLAVQVLGMGYGPVAYLRSAAHARRQR